MTVGFDCWWPRLCRLFSVSYLPIVDNPIQSVRSILPTHVQLFSIQSPTSLSLRILPLLRLNALYLQVYPNVRNDIRRLARS